MVEPLRPVKGGFLRPFGAGWFIREYLAGNGPEGSTKIDPARGAPQVDISYEYKETLSRVTARERAEKIISDKVIKNADVSEAKERLKDAEFISQKEFGKYLTKRKVKR